MEVLVTGGGTWLVSTYLEQTLRRKHQRGREVHCVAGRPGHQSSRVQHTTAGGAGFIKVFMYFELGCVVGCEVDA